jgi:hypothetical protein
LRARWSLKAKRAKTMEKATIAKSSVRRLNCRQRREDLVRGEETSAVASAAVMRFMVAADVAEV